MIDVQKSITIKISISTLKIIWDINNVSIFQNSPPSITLNEKLYISVVCGNIGSSFKAY
jgi:hypothetical protein